MTLNPLGNNNSSDRFIPRLTMMGRGRYSEGPSWRDFLAIFLTIGVILLLGSAAHEMVMPFVPSEQPEISLSWQALPMYALRTVMRMLIALIASLIFTFIYATLAAKSKRAEMVLIPILDILQSVPILGYLSFTVLFFVSLFPGNILGPELAAIFAIFTSQAWNMAFSFYQSLKTIPTELQEVSESFRFTSWQRFFRLEVPFSMPGLVWNMMISMSCGWFFVVASEAIAVGDFQVKLPGIGSYVAKAIEEKDLTAIFFAIIAMTITIFIYDQLLFRPLVAWSDKFRMEQTAAQIVPRSYVLDLFQRTTWIKRIVENIQDKLDRLFRARCAPPAPFKKLVKKIQVPSKLIDYIWYSIIFAFILYIGYEMVHYGSKTLHFQDLLIVLANASLTLFRVALLILIATLIWVPVGIYVGLRPRLAEKIQPIAQFLAAFPANLFFPIVVYLIVHFHLNPIIWLTPLIILGTQWYILFNVIAGASAFPNELKEAAASLRISNKTWWKKVILPGIFPYYITGALTASGGAWNASIVAEAVSWGDTHLNGLGIGAYIAEMTTKGDFPRIALGVAVMSVFVTIINRLFWRPLYKYAELQARLD